MRLLQVTRARQRGASVAIALAVPLLTSFYCRGAPVPFLVILTAAFLPLPMVCLLVRPAGDGAFLDTLVFVAVAFAVPVLVNALLFAIVMTQVPFP